MSTKLPPLMRYRAMLEWLRKVGLTEYAVRNWIKRRYICGKALRRGGWAWYSPLQIWRDVLRDFGVGEVEIADHPAEPPYPLMPYGVMRDWLGKWGIRECELLALMKAGVIQGKRLPPARRHYYSTAQIKKNVLEPLLANDARQKRCDSTGPTRRAKDSPSSPRRPSKSSRV